MLSVIPAPKPSRLSERPDVFIGATKIVGIEVSTVVSTNLSVSDLKVKNIQIP